MSLFTVLNFFVGLVGDDVSSVALQQVISDPSVGRNSTLMHIIMVREQGNGVLIAARARPDKKSRKSSMVVPSYILDDPHTRLNYIK